MEFDRGFVLSDDRFLQPVYRISPFRTEDIAKNKRNQFSDKISSYFEQRFNGKPYLYTMSGRAALNKAFLELKLNKNDCITIITTSGNAYVSSCVTNEIEKFCGWSREIESNSKAVLVIHEFGFPVENLSKLLDYNLPIIEDCAHSFISQNNEKTVGKLGDYVIYSLPKIFPIQFGGILVSNKKDLKDRQLNDTSELYLIKNLSYYIKDIDIIKSKRVANYRYLKERLGKSGLTERFSLEDSYCPGVYMFKSKNVNFPELKLFLQKHGIECSVFYGEESFFIPLNQSLNQDDLDFIIWCINIFIGRN